jgi:fibronectin-binding autotransporter adhesin
MPTYFARKAGNINAADVWATTPSGTAAAVTFASGDVLMANSFTVTVNVSTDLGGTGQVRNDTTGGATGGGVFTLSDGITLTANIFGGTVNSTNCVTANPSTNVWIVGNITGGAAGLSYGLNNATGTGTINVTGNVSAGSSSFNAAIGIALTNATLIVSGNVTGGAAGAGTQGEGIRVSAAGSCTVTGTVTGGGTTTAYGVRCTSSGNTTVVGSAIGGVTAPAINNESTGQVTVTRAVGNGFGGGSVGLSAAFGVSNVASQSSITIVEQIEFGTLGQNPVNGRIRLKKANTNVAAFNFCDTAGAKTLIDATTNASMPAATDVRSGVSYASGAQTGSCAVPAAGSVALGVPVDATTGTAVLTPEAVWGHASRTLTAGAGISASDVWDYATRSLTTSSGPTAVQIRQEMDSNSTKLANLDATVSSRLAPSGTLATVTTLTNAPTVPTAAAIATQVRSELTTELNRLDTNVGSRAASGTLASDVTAIKAKTDAVNVDRINNTATTAIVGNLLAQANS